MNGLTRALVILVALVIAVGAGAGLVAMRFLGTPASEETSEVVFEVKPGASFKAVARKLEEQGLVSSAWKLELYARATGLGPKVRVGEYAISRGFTPKEVLAVLVSGRSVEYSVTVSEGLNRFEIAEILQQKNIATKDEFLALVTDRDFIREVLDKDYVSLEGYLFPETYHVTKFTGAKGLVRMMVDRFKENFARLKATPGWGAVGLTDHELVTLASIVEKETGAPEERPVISSVFHNRLRMKMPLQTDPTIIYGIWEQTGSWNRNLSRADLQTPGRYNSYLNMGLPPGPIANPGFEALRAAGAPEQTPYLFFVSRNDGTHVFSKEYAQHAKAVTQFQIDRKAREGKSWRDLQKREKTPDQVVAAPPPTAAPGKKANQKPSEKPKLTR